MDADEDTVAHCAASNAELAERLSSLLSKPPYVLHSRLPPERKLAEILSVSRNRIRGALGLLEEQGRIWRAVGKGTFIGGRPESVSSCPESLASATTLAEIFEVRSALEPIIASLAAVRAEKQDIEMMIEYSAAADNAQNWEEWERWDALIHRAIVEASGNGLFINIIDQLLQIKLHPRWTLKKAEFNRELVYRYGRDHSAIISCIIARDADGARNAMMRHTSEIRSTVGPTISGILKP